MDLEEFKKFMKTDEGKAIVQATVDEAVTGLKNKNDDLIKKNKKEKEEKEALEERLEALEEEANKGKKVDVEKEKQKLIDKHEKEMKDIKEKADIQAAQINKLVVENGLAEALTKANISPVHTKAVAALIKASNKIELDANGDTPTAKIGDKVLGDFVKAWAESDEGKHYVSAPGNSGGSANGSGSGAGGSDMSKLSPTERLTAARSGKK